MDQQQAPTHQLVTRPHMPPAVKVVNAASDVIGATAEALTSVAYLFTANLAVHKLAIGAAVPHPSTPDANELIIRPFKESRHATHQP